MGFLDFLFPPRVDESTLRTVSLDEFSTLVSPHLVSVTRPGTVTLLSFANPTVRAAIHEAKYHGSDRAFDYLARVLADYLRDADDIGHTRSMITLIPVPLGDTRRKERGYNQVEEVARRAATELGCTLAPELLMRSRETPSQVSLAREAREENMRGAFTAPRPLSPLSTYILLDDVITTGATLQAAIDALTKAGARHLVPLALAH